MKLVISTLAAVAAATAAGAWADPPTSADPSQCISVIQIDHTEVPDDSTILFHLRGGRILKNALPQKCVGLRMSTRGFTYSAGSLDEVCGNLQTIRVNDTGSICMLGPFTPYTPPAKAP
jgi:hypothetical protein